MVLRSTDRTAKTESLIGISAVVFWTSLRSCKILVSVECQPYGFRARAGTLCDGEYIRECYYCHYPGYPWPHCWNFFTLGLVMTLGYHTLSIMSKYINGMGSKYWDKLALIKIRDGVFDAWDYYVVQLRAKVPPILKSRTAVVIFTILFYLKH